MKRFLKILLRTFIVLFVFINIVTAFHAYKFTHFYEAGEITVKPDSLKSGWEKTKEMLFGINFAKQKNTVPDSAVQTVWLSTKSGLKLEGWYKTVDSAKGTVCMFHGHGGKKSGTNAEAEGFRKLGYNTFQLDFRAHGGSQGNTCTIGYDESEDVKLAYDYIKSKNEKNILLWGISMGASTIIKSIKDYQLQPAKIMLEMPFGSITSAVEGRLKIMGLPAQPLGTLLTFWGGTEHGFWAFNMQPSDFAKKIACPVLLQWGANDPRVTKGEIDDTYNNISTAKKLVVYETAGHESLCKKENEKWMGEVSSFLK